MIHCLNVVVLFLSSLLKNGINLSLLHKKFNIIEICYSSFLKKIGNMRLLGNGLTLNMLVTYQQVLNYLIVIATSDIR